MCTIVPAVRTIRFSLRPGFNAVAAHTISTSTSAYLCIGTRTYLISIANSQYEADIKYLDLHTYLK